MKTPVPAAMAALLGLAAAWIAAGSTGLLAHALRHALAWIALGACVLLGWPAGQRRIPRLLILVGALALAVPMLASALAPVNVAGVALVLGAVAFAQTSPGTAASAGSPEEPPPSQKEGRREEGPGKRRKRPHPNPLPEGEGTLDRHPLPEGKGTSDRPLCAAVLGLVVEAVLVLAVYRLACASIPWFWLAADAVGEGLGRVAGWLCGRRLWVGATFGGLDFLVVMLYLAVMAPLRLKKGISPICAKHRAPPAGWSGRSAANWTYPLFRIAAPVLAVLAAQMLYLSVVALWGDCMQVKPGSAKPPTYYEEVNPPPATLKEIAAKLIPWNLPALAGVMHLVLAAWGLLWWAPRLESEGQPRGQEDKDKKEGSAPAEAGRPVWLEALLAGMAVVLAAVLPLATTLCPGGGDLRGKKIVIYEKGFLNWLKPEHDQFGRWSIGMYGMMPEYLRSLGAKPLVSKDLSKADLQGADAMVLLFPDDPWTDEQLRDIWGFVRDGGTLAVFGEHTIMESPPKPLVGAACLLVAGSSQGFSPAGGASAGGLVPVLAPLAASGRFLESRFNEALEPTAMRVRFDSATFAVGGWLQSYEALAHPTTAGIGDTRNEFGAVIGASVRTRWPARPLLVGRYGWGDPGDWRAGTSMMGNHLYDAGEKLGDLVLAAEQPLGQGRVIAFGDTSGMTNGLTVGCHRYTSRLLRYLASTSSTPLDAWRQLVGLLAALGLVGLLIARPNPWTLPAVALVMAITLAVCTEASYRAWNVVPGPGKIAPDVKTPGAEKAPDGEQAPGGEGPPVRVAYIDASHAPAFASEGWRDEGVMGLAMTLMRNGYLALLMPDLTRQRLLRPGVTRSMLKDLEVPPGELLQARLLVSIAPGREYSAEERLVIRDFVRAGGILICMAGYEERGPIQSLLAGTAPRPAPPGTPRTLTDAGRFKKTEEYRQTYDETFKQEYGKEFQQTYGRILRETGNPELAKRQAAALAEQRAAALADAHAAALAGRFHLLNDTEEYKERYDELLRRLRAQGVDERHAEKVARQRAALYAACYAEPYGDEAGFGFHVGVRPSASDRPAREPEPLGQCRAQFFQGRGYGAYARFFAAWPVYCDDPDALVVASQSVGFPVVILRRYGRGLVAVIGDTCFAMNKNLEDKEGRVFEWTRENADFWRWFLAFVAEGQMWYPPRPKGIPLPADATPLESPLLLPPESLPAPKSAPAGRQPEKGDQSHLPRSGPEGASHKWDLSPFSGRQPQGTS